MYSIHSYGTLIFKSLQSQQRWSTLLKEMGPCFWWSFFNFSGQWEDAARTSPPPIPAPFVFESAKKQAPSEGKAEGCQPRSCCLPCWRLVLPGRFAGIRARAYRLSFCAQEQAGSLPQTCLPSHTAAVSVLWERFPPRRSHRGRWWSFQKGALTHTVGICVTGHPGNEEKNRRRV